MAWGSAEPQKQSLRQRESRELHKNTQARRSQSRGISRSCQSPARHPTLSGTHLQQQAVALRAWLPATVRDRRLAAKQKGSGVTFFKEPRRSVTPISKSQGSGRLQLWSPSSYGQPGGCCPTILVLTSPRIKIPRQVALQQSLLLPLQLQAILEN